MNTHAAFRRVLMAMAMCLSWAVHAQTTHDVTVGNNFFSPSDLTIEPGDTVRWTNAAGGPSHDVTADDFSFASVTAPGFTFEMTFEDEGDVPYHCTVHSVPGGTNMNGIIRVEASGGGGSVDLAVNSVDAQAGTYEPGDTVAVDVSIQNIGDDASGNYSLTYYASEDANITGADTVLGGETRGSVAAGAMDNFVGNPAFPNDIDEGTWFIGLIIDTDDADPANNTGVDNASVAVEAPQLGADLTLNSITVVDQSTVQAGAGSQAEAVQGGTIVVDAEVENIGDAASEGFAIDYYASTNNDISTQDRLLGTENRAALGVGASSSGAFQVSIPENLGPGDFFIGALLDVNDADNGNNEAVDPTPITVAASGGFVINEGLNDSWFNPATGGQGFFITVFPDIQKIFLAWFTYELERPPGDVTAMLGEPGHRWLTAFGDYAGDTATLEVEITQGGIFDSPEPVPTQGPDGTITVTFSDCNTATVDYDITSVARSGSVPIRRLADDNIPFCESLAGMAAQR